MVLDDLFFDVMLLLWLFLLLHEAYAWLRHRRGRSGTRLA
jgi:hypothetical protein